VARFPLLDLGVHDLCAAVGEVGCGVGARGRRTLDDDHSGPLEHRGKQPDPAVRVDDGVGIGEVRARLGNRCHQQLSGGRAGLEERRRADLEIPSGDVLVDDRAGPDTDVGGHVEELDITIGHPRRAFPTGVPHPETDLSVTANLHRRQKVLQARMTDGTGVELDDVVRGPTSQTETTPVDGQAVGEGLMVSSPWLSRIHETTKQRVEREKQLTNPFSLRAALAFGAVYALVLVGARAAQAYFGPRGIYVAALFSSIVDVDAITIALSRLGPGLDAWRAIAGAITLGLVMNTLVKLGIAIAAGAPPFRRAVTMALGGTAIAGALSGLAVYRWY